MKQNNIEDNNLNNIFRIANMNSIIKLSTDDWRIKEGKKGNLICNNIKGLSIVLFWSPKCKYCRTLEPNFRQLPTMMKGITFASINISENIGIIAMAEDTITPILTVPNIMVFIDGKPYMQYDDKPDIDSVVNFIKYIMQLIETKKEFAKKNPAGSKQENEIPPYSIARPYHDLCGDNEFCYLAQSDAYKGLK